jgi:hypothetical protein
MLPTSHHLRDNKLLRRHKTLNFIKYKREMLCVRAAQKTEEIYVENFTTHKKDDFHFIPFAILSFHHSFLNTEAIELKCRKEFYAEDITFIYVHKVDSSPF